MLGRHPGHKSNALTHYKQYHYHCYIILLDIIINIIIYIAINIIPCFCADIKNTDDDNEKYDSKYSDLINIIFSIGHTHHYLHGMISSRIREILY